MTTERPFLLLIVNDGQVRYLIERYGERSGCRVISVDSVAGAFDLLLRERPVMILLHLTAWPHDGWILRRLRESRVAQAIPITIMSALADEARARAEGATYWLWQPVMYGDFLAVLMAAAISTPSATSAAPPLQDLQRER